MKKFLLSLLCSLSLLFCFSSCNKEANDLIVGRWKSLRSGMENIFEFKAGGDFLLYVDGKLLTEGSWQIKGKELELKVLSYDFELEDSDAYFEFTNNNNTLLLRDEPNEKPYLELQRI